MNKTAELINKAKEGLKGILKTEQQKRLEDTATGLLETLVVIAELGKQEMELTVQRKQMEIEQRKHIEGKLLATSNTDEAKAILEIKDKYHNENYILDQQIKVEKLRQEGLSKKNELDRLIRDNNNLDRSMRTGKELA